MSGRTSGPNNQTKLVQILGVVLWVQKIVLRLEKLSYPNGGHLRGRFSRTILDTICMAISRSIYICMVAGLTEIMGLKYGLPWGKSWKKGVAFSGPWENLD